MDETIVKVANKTDNFTIISNDVARRKDISARAKGLYFYLMTLPTNWEIHKAEIFEHFTEGRDAMNKAFNELIENGYIEKIIKRDEKKRFIEFTYKAYEESINGKSVSGYPLTENPFTGFPLTGKPLMENPQLLSTDIILSTDKLSTEGKNKRFIVPTLEEVKQYCQERKNRVDAELFLDYYEAKGWMIGKNKMKNWRAAVRTWEKNDKERKPDIGTYTRPKCKCGGEFNPGGFCKSCGAEIS